MNDYERLAAEARVIYAALNLISIELRDGKFTLSPTATEARDTALGIGLLRFEPAKTKELMSIIEGRAN